MAEAAERNFYHLMLELPEQVTSPDHYELLGLERFQDDEAAIRNAAIDANEKLLAWQNSNYHAECDRLMDAVVKAREVLLDDKQRAKYDRSLRRRLGIEEPHDVALIVDQDTAPTADEEVPLTEETPSTQAETGTAFNRTLLLGLGGMAAVVSLLVGLGVLLWSSGKSQPANPGHQALTIVVEPSGPNPTNADSVEFDVTFSTGVKNVDFRNFQLNLSDVSADTLLPGDVTERSAGDLKTFRVVVRNISGDGTVGLELARTEEFVSESGRRLDLMDYKHEAYTIDNTGPRVTLRTPEDREVYNSTTWPGEVSGTASDANGVSKVELAIRQEATGKYWNGSNAFDGDEALPLRPTGTESWRLQLAAQLLPADGKYIVEASAADEAGNVGSTETATLTLDTTAPTVKSVKAHNSSQADSTDVEFTVNFSEPVSGVDTSDFSATNIQSGDDWRVQKVLGSGATYTVTVNTGANGGTARLDVLSGSTIEDSAANSLDGAFTAGSLVKVKPPHLKSPFDAKRCMEARRQWADYLGTDVTLTNSVSIDFVLIPPGEFEMDAPKHPVRVTSPFHMQTTEVTQSQWETVMKTAPWTRKRFVKKGPDYPATHVSWDAAQEFCRRLSEKERATYRLPTEAEWEYACRAGTTSTFYFGDDRSQLDDYAWHPPTTRLAGEPYAHAVALKKPNQFGLYDMHGNVSEWCQDWYDKFYGFTGYYASGAHRITSLTIDPMGPSAGSERVVRGGAWNAGAASAMRWQQSANVQNEFLGFRVVLGPLTNAASTSPPSNWAGEVVLPNGTEDFAVPLPSWAVIKGNFAAWTQPADPAPFQNYFINITVKLPKGVTSYKQDDLSGLVIGTDGYMTPLGNYRGNKFPKKYYGKFDMDTKTLVVRVPGAKEKVKDTIQVESQVLGEKQQLEIVF